MLEFVIAGGGIDSTSCINAAESYHSVVCIYAPVVASAIVSGSVAVLT